MPGSNKKQVLFRHFLWNVQKFTSSEENIFAVLLVFLWEMPVMNGYEAAKAIRASGRADADIPIIAMTANAFAEDERQALACGMNAHVAKPIDVHTLERVVAKLSR
mgnify:CR=1 FL=1